MIALTTMMHTEKPCAMEAMYVLLHFPLRQLRPVYCCSS